MLESGERDRLLVKNEDGRRMGSDGMEGGGWKERKNERKERKKERRKESERKERKKERKGRMKERKKGKEERNAS